MTNTKDFPVYDVLPEGKGNAVGAEELARYFGMKSTRDLRSEILRERENGAIILMDNYNGGYYRSNEIEDVKECYSILLARARATLSSIKAMKKWLSEREDEKND